jgi:uncharacterized membrane protein
VSGRASGGGQVKARREPRPAPAAEDVAPRGHRQVTEAELAEIPQPPRWVPIAALLLSLLGLGDAIYLTISHFNNSLITAGCSVHGAVNCLKVTTSPESEIFGVIPVAIVGLGYFVLMTIVNLPPLWKTYDVRVVWARLALVVAGLGMVVYLISVEVHLKAICEYCTGVHAITLLLFVLVLATFSRMSNRAAWYRWYQEGGDAA